MKDAYIDKLIEWLEKSADIAATELPAFANEIVSYGIGSSIMYILVEIIVATLLIKCFKLCKLTGDEDLDIIKSLCFVFSFGAIIILSLCFVNSANDLCKAYFAPKLYCIEMVRGK